jgi:membrane protease YdiL (CAAX protease family)
VSGAAPAAHRWGLREALLGFAAGIILSSVAAAVVGAATSARTGTSARTVTGAPLGLPVLVADLAGLWVALVGAALLACRRHGTGSLARDLGLRLGRWWDLVVGATVGLGCQYGLIPLLYLPFERADPTLAHRIAQPAQTDTGSAHTVGALVVLLVFLAVGAPIVEELFFRGLLLRGLAGRLPVPVAVAASGLLFALAHFEAVQFAGLAVFGVVLGVLAWRSGRLGPSVAAHAAFNAAAVVGSVHLH